jgi:protein SCO1/2
MNVMTRRKALGMMGSGTVVAGIGAVAARGFGVFGRTRPKFQPMPASGPESARAMIQQKHLPNVALITQDGRSVRFYDDLVKDKKVVFTFINTDSPTDSAKVSKNLASLQKFFGDRMGKDIHMYTLTTNPTHDTPAVLKGWAAQYSAGPGWTFLTGSAANVEKLRQSLGFASEFAADQADPNFSIGVFRYGTESQMRWGHCQAFSSPRVLAHSLLLDFGTDPADPSPPPVWNCSKLTAGLS